MTTADIIAVILLSIWSSAMTAGFFYRGDKIGYLESYIRNAGLARWHVDDKGKSQLKLDRKYRSYHKDRDVFDGEYGLL